MSIIVLLFILLLHKCASHGAIHNVVMIFLAFQIFYFHIFLAIQDILCIWLHAAGLLHSSYCHCMCHNCEHVFPAKC